MGYRPRTTLFLDGRLTSGAWGASSATGYRAIEGSGEWAGLGVRSAWDGKEKGSLRKATKPRARRGILFLLLAGIVFCCLAGTLLPLPATASSRPGVAEVPSGPVGADHGAGHVYRGVADASVPVPDVSYALLPPAEEVRETEKLPVNALVLTMLALAIASFGAGAFWLPATNARVRGSGRRWSVGDDRRRLAAVCGGPCYLGVFLL